MTFYSRQKFSQEGYKRTGSVVVAEGHPNKPFNDFIQRAYRALYQAKSTGHRSQTRFVVQKTPYSEKMLRTYLKTHRKDAESAKVHKTVRLNFFAYSASLRFSDRLLVYNKGIFR